MSKRMNALWNCHNPFQGKTKKVLTVCSAGLLRSPTIAWYLTTKYNYNCRATGIHDYALIQVDDVLVEWADWIICSDPEKHDYILEKYGEYLHEDQQVTCLNLPDIYEYCQPELVSMIEEQLPRYLNKEDNGN